MHGQRGCIFGFVVVADKLLYYLARVRVRVRVKEGCVCDR